MGWCLSVAGSSCFAGLILLAESDLAAKALLPSQKGQIEVDMACLWPAILAAKIEPNQKVKDKLVRDVRMDWQSLRPWVRNQKIPAGCIRS